MLSYKALYNTPPSPPTQKSQTRMIRARREERKSSSTEKSDEHESRGDFPEVAVAGRCRG